MKKKIYFKNLDGLRFLCFLSVFFYHSFFTEFSEIKNSGIYHFVKRDLFGNGNIGVNFFFVLSGFLITFLLIEEKKLNGQVNLKNFWIRRILRIWPLFYFCVFIGFIIFPFLKQMFDQIPNETANPLFYLTFTNNFDAINKGLPDASILGVLWSVAIEEQFYLLWPIVIYIFPLKKLWIPFSIIIANSLIFRAFNDNAVLYEWHTFSCIGDMAIGATGAWLMSVSANFKKIIENLSKIQIGFIYLIFILIFLFRDEFLLSNFGVRIFERIFIAIVIILIILEQTFSDNSLFKMAKFKIISKLGVITYGLYCLHFIGILVTITLTKKLSLNSHLWQVFFLETAIALSLTILISMISYKYFETPFLKLKDKFSYITK
ncbi:MAG: acyltransferase [Bacteroidetes bacterium]|nr:acyltransferase [Bacteroidota bacterium]